MPLFWPSRGIRTGSGQSSQLLTAGGLRHPTTLADEDAAPSAGRPALPGCRPCGVRSTGREEAPKLINTFKARFSWLHRWALTPRAGLLHWVFPLPSPLRWASLPTLCHPHHSTPGPGRAVGCVLPANSPLFHRHQPEGQAIPRPYLSASSQPVSPPREAFPKAGPDTEAPKACCRMHSPRRQGRWGKAGQVPRWQALLLSTLLKGRAQWGGRVRTPGFPKNGGARTDHHSLVGSQFPHLQSGANNAYNYGFRSSP